MGKQKLSRDQKRKHKLAKKKQERRSDIAFEIQPYLGSKYRTKELVPLWLETECGIYDSYVISDRKLFDNDVVLAIRELYQRVAASRHPEESVNEDFSSTTSMNSSQLIVCNVLLHWMETFREKPRPTREDWLGVLRSILGTIDQMRLPGPQSRSYLQYIERFLTKDVNYKSLVVQGSPSDDVFEDASSIVSISYEPIEDDADPEIAAEGGQEFYLLGLGRAWIDSGSEVDQLDFIEELKLQVSDGYAPEVRLDCLQLIQEIDDSTHPISQEIVRLLHDDAIWAE